MPLYTHSFNPLCGMSAKTILRLTDKNIVKSTLTITETKDFNTIAELNANVRNLHTGLHAEMFKPFDRIKEPGQEKWHFRKLGRMLAERIIIYCNDKIRQ